MRTRLFQFIAVVLLLCGAGVTTSCSDDFKTIYGPGVVKTEFTFY